MTLAFRSGLALSIGCLGSAAATAAEPGYGPWRLGMSKAEVAAVSEYGPYKDVRVTGGLETPNGSFDGRKANISFAFGENSLVKIQIWAYEGVSLDEAVANWFRVQEYFRRTYGDVESPSLKLKENEAIDKKDFEKQARSLMSDVPPGGRIQLAPHPMPVDVKVYSSLFRTPGGFMVFVFYQKP